MKYDQVISLGWFCGPAMEIKRIGLRNASYPFDWLLTHDFRGLISAIAEEKSFRLYNEDMLQYNADPSRWYNSRYTISLFHDFSPYQTMVSQLDDVNQKYLRRFRRFYAAIRKPTLFLRYVKDREEMQYISENTDHILQILKKFNPHNDVIYIADPALQDITLNGAAMIYYITPDSHDTVARKFLENCSELEKILKTQVSSPKTPYPYEQKSEFREKLQRPVNRFRPLAVNDNPIHQEGVLEKPNKSEIILFHELSECSGCGACVAICPKNALSMQVWEGFYYPEIDREKCIQCTKCLQICPFKDSQF